MSSFSERPTLPPLHTLNLLPASHDAQRRGSLYDSYEPPCQSPNLPQYSWSQRRVSTSTSTSTSRTPSPTPSNGSSASSTSSSPTSPLKSSKLTLVPCSFEAAQAVVVIPPPGTPHAPGTRPGQGFLVTGPALKHLRHAERQIAKGTRLHPYRFAGRRGSVPSP